MWGWRCKAGRFRGTRALETTESSISALEAPKSSVGGRTHALERPKSLIRLDRASLLSRIHGPWLCRKWIYRTKWILLLPNRLRGGRRRHSRGLHWPATDTVSTGAHRRSRRLRERAGHTAHREGRAVCTAIGIRACRPGRLWSGGGSERRVRLGARGAGAAEGGAEQVAEEGRVIVGLRDAKSGRGRGG